MGHLALVTLLALLLFAGCHSAKRDPNTLVFLIEASPANLDPRVGTDGQSEHLDEILFDALVEHDASFGDRPHPAEISEVRLALNLFGR